MIKLVVPDTLSKCCSAPVSLSSKKTQRGEAIFLFCTSCQTPCEHKERKSSYYISATYITPMKYKENWT